MSEENNFSFSQFKTIPNMLSISRLLLIPALAIPSFLMADESQARHVFLVMFIIIGVTDKLDGTIARYLNQTSHLGAKLDTMADMVFYPLITIWLYRFAPEVVDGWWTLVFLLAGLFFAKMILGKIKFGEIPVFHTIGGKTFAASLFFFMIVAILSPDSAAKIFPVLCVIGYVNQLEEMYIFMTKEKVDENIRSAFD